MASAKKQNARRIVSSFLGSESDNAELLSNKKLLRYSPNVEFFINSAEEYLVAIVRNGELKLNPVYRITDLKLIPIIESFAQTTNGEVLYYKVPAK